MSITDLLISLRELDILISLDGENLKINAPKGALTPALQTELKTNKAEIIVHLQAEAAAQIIQPTDRSQPIPASSSQRGLWFQYQLEGGGSTYNVPVIYRLNGSLNTSVLEKALQYLIQRHESLRMSFKAIDGEPYLQIVENPVWRLDLRPLKESHEDASLLSVASETFDLETAPLFRAHLWTNERDEHILLLSFHHIITDGWSQGIFERELNKVYNALIASNNVTLPPLTLDYTDYAAWQNNWVASEAGKQGLRYWTEHLRGAPEILELPQDYLRPTAKTYQGNQIKFGIKPDLLNQLRSLAQRENLSLFMLLNAALAILLGRYSRQDDVVIGIPMANRKRNEWENVIGYFVNTLPVRINLGGNPSLDEFLRNVRKAFLNGYAQQDVPMNELIKEINPFRDPGVSSVFQVIFDYVNTPLEGLKLGDSESHFELAHIGASIVDLSLMAFKQGGELKFELIFNTDIFKKRSIEQMLEHYKNILRWMISSSIKGIHEFDFMSESERQKILVGRNDTSTEYPADRLLHELFETQAKQTPDAIAIVSEEAQITYAELDMRANQLAVHLRELGLGPDKIGCLFLPRSINAIIGILGILKAGGAYLALPINEPEERLSVLLTDAESEVLITTKELGKKLPVEGMQLLFIDANWADNVPASKPNPCSGQTPESLACLIYTSGSTGKPKGVMLTHHSLVCHFYSDQKIFQRNPNDRILHHMSLSFDFALWEIFIALLYGARLVIADEEKHVDIHYLASLIKKEKITIAGFVPSHLDMLLDAINNHDKNSLRQVLCGGEVLSPELQERFLQANSAKLFNTYGPTEATIDATCWECKLGETRKSIPIGRANLNTELYILDNQLQPVSVGVPGELLIGGPTVARGYLKRLELTTEKFIQNPFKAERSILYKTGDLVRWLPDGNIEFVGRIDTQVKVRGFRVELGEIENALNGEVSVRDVLVIVREDQPGNKQLVAYIIPPDAPHPNATELRNSLKKKLPAYMIPAAFMFLDSFPLTINRKIDRKALPVPVLEITKGDVVQPETEMEESLVKVWTKVLGIASLGVDEDFFEMGGNSLLAVRLVAAIEQEVGVRLPLVDLFRAPTVRQLAALLDAQNSASVWTPLIPIQTEGDGTPLFIVHSPAAAKNIAAELQAGWPVYAIEASGLEASTEQDTTIEEMAERYLETIRSVQPNGPYRLVGYCTGGAVIYDIAQRLRVQGEEISLLLELEGFSVNTLTHSWAFWLERLWKNIPFWFRKHIQSGKILERIRAGKQNTPSVEDWQEAAEFVNRRENEAEEEFVQRLQEHVAALDAAQFSYRPHPYDGRVTVFSCHWRSPSEAIKLKADPTLGWGKLAQAGVDVYSFDGDHDNFYRPPHVADVAKTLKDILERLDAAEESVLDA